jgi:hypothetical protein
MKRDIKNVFSAATLLASLVALGCEGPTEYFRTAQIDPLTMKMNLGGRLTSPPHPGIGFYQRTTAQQGYSVLYFKPDKRVDPDLLMMTAKSVIETKSSLQVLIRGDYGTVYVSTTHWYPPIYQAQPIDFHAELWFSGPNPATPERVQAFNQTIDLSAVTVIRVFRAPPEFLVVCATYGYDGHVTTLSVNGSRGGDWVHSNELLPLYKDLDIATSYGDRPRTLRYFGLPETFPIAGYLRDYRPAFTPVKLELYQDVINLHYRRNEYVRQDVFPVTGTRTTEFLRYPSTAAFQALKPIDDRMPFGLSSR